MLLEAQETGASIDYGTVAKTYWTRIDKTVKLAIPTFTILMPRIPKMLKLAKERLRNVNSFKVRMKQDGEFSALRHIERISYDCAKIWLFSAVIVPYRVSGVFLTHSSGFRIL